MSKINLKKNLVALLPRGRRYSRALVGETGLADTLLLTAATNVINLAPSVSLLTPKKMVLPLLFVELHKVIDSGPVDVVFPPHEQPDRFDSPLYEQFDGGLKVLSDVQKRAYLLVALERIKMPAVAQILGLTVEQVREYFHQSHRLVTHHIVTNFAHNDAAETAQQ